MFLLFALGAFYGFRQQNWIVGGVSGALATASSPTGIVILPALAWIGFRQSGARRLWVVIALLLTAAGFGAYLSYMYYRAGPPGGWGAAMNQWGFHLGQAPWLSLQQLFTSHASPVDAVNGAVTLIALASVPFVWWRLDGGYAIYMLLMLWLPLTSGKYDDLGRTCALLFPLFILIASIRWRVVFIGVAVASAMFYALGLAL
jgi:Gpi18-like mannosyltransferase